VIGALFESISFEVVFFSTMLKLTYKSVKHKSKPQAVWHRRDAAMMNLFWQKLSAA
jgi:hypothetical protein